MSTKILENPNRENFIDICEAPTPTAARLLEAIEVERQVLRDLFGEHRELRDQNAELLEQLIEQHNGRGAEAAGDIEQRLSDAELRCELLKTENSELGTSYQTALEQSNNLFMLYVASHRLHSTLALGEVMDVISEIVLNLVGADCYSILFYDEAEPALRPVLVRGIKRDSIKPVPSCQSPFPQSRGPEKQW